MEQVHNFGGWAEGENPQKPQNEEEQSIFQKFMYGLITCFT